MKAASFIGLSALMVILTVVINAGILIGAVWLVVKALHWFGVL